MFVPLPFQKDAIDELIDTTISLWKIDESQLPIVFKSPTGSGKTFVMAHYVQNLNKQPNWNIDKSFIWITFSDDLAMQSLRKFQEYFENTLENNLLTVHDINQGKLSKNDILFMNWQKVVSRSAENRVLRRPDDERMIKESGFYFEDFIDGTKKDNREIILIIDEAHTNVTPDLAQQIIEYIDPKIVVHVSATPPDSVVAIAANIDSFIKVDRNRVVEEGLIKEKIITQTHEDLLQYSNRDLDEVLIDLGLEKRESLCNEFKSLNKKVNPLLLIQLPNDDSERIKMGEKTKETIAVDYLKQKGISEKVIGRWFDDHPKPDGIEENDDTHEILIFKLAAGTGWDCPRAHVLVMFRNIRVEQRFLQTIGRILRMPEPTLKADYKDNPNLRTGYLYTNYNRRDVIDNWIDKNQNKPFIFEARKKENINNIQLISAYISRVNYGDLSNSSEFQKSFINSLNEFFNIKDDEEIISAREKLLAHGLDLDPLLLNKIVIDAEFSDFDNINFDFKRVGNEVSYVMSVNDVEKTFNYLCFELLKEQTDVDAKVTNISRSWSPLKSALRVWMKNNIDPDSDVFYRIFIKDIQKGASSSFRPAITKALKDYRPIMNKLLEERARYEEEKEAPIFSINDFYWYTEDYESYEVKKFVLDKFYLRKNYRGKNNELSFIDYIDNKENKIEWWFKQEIGRDYYAIKYFNTVENEYSLFYPDWIIRFSDSRIGIFDTKKGSTATETQGRAEALAKKIKELGNKYLGGIVLEENGVWYFNDSENYSYVPGKMDENWKRMEVLFR